MALLVFGFIGKLFVYRVAVKGGYKSVYYYFFIVRNCQNMF